MTVDKKILGYFEREGLRPSLTHTPLSFVKGVKGIG